MITIEVATEFLGWCAIINLSLLALTTILVISLNSKMSALHAKVFNLEPREVNRIYFQYLGAYKIATIVFNIVPYIVLKMMGQ